MLDPLEARVKLAGPPASIIGYQLRPPRGPPRGTHFTLGSQTFPALLKARRNEFSPAGGSYAQAIQFDPKKDKANVEKHGLSLEQPASWIS